MTDLRDRWGSWTGPNHPDKGKLNGRCNRTDCQRPPATWFNTSTRAYYCPRCAHDITSFAKRADGFHICFPTSGDADEDAKIQFREEPASQQAQASQEEPLDGSTPLNTPEPSSSPLVGDEGP